MDGFHSLQVFNIITCLGVCLEPILLRWFKTLLLLNVISVVFIIATLFTMSSNRTSVEDSIKLVYILGWSDGAASIVGSNAARWVFLLPSCCHTPGIRNPLA